ncbi:MAG: hypothetical protein IIB95_06460 [Candidatus Marinimicrobia bacterium]|nr:hypothetical protein [Candidatus Neomarinimicrobiota bacterium]
MNKLTWVRLVNMFANGEVDVGRRLSRTVPNCVLVCSWKSAKRSSNYVLLILKNQKPN